MCHQGKWTAMPSTTKDYLLNSSQHKENQISVKIFAFQSLVHVSKGNRGNKKEPNGLNPSAVLDASKREQHFLKIRLKDLGAWRSRVGIEVLSQDVEQFDGGLPDHLLVLGREGVGDEVVHRLPKVVDGAVSGFG
jgi:hypothetical protein